MGAFVVSPRFTSCPPAYHTHLAGLARTVSLHRASPPQTDYRPPDVVAKVGMAGLSRVPRPIAGALL